MLIIFRLLCPLLWLLRTVEASQTVIDDSDPIIDYQPPSRWQVNAPGQPKTGLAAPDPGLVRNSTWHDVSYDIGIAAVSLSFPFNGTGLAVYCMLWHLANADSDGPSSNPNLSLTTLSFTLDGTLAGSYTSGPYQHVASTTYSYNVSVFQNLAIPAGAHTFSMNLEPNSMALFDYYVIYDSDPTPEQKGSSSLAIILVVAGAGLLGIGSVVILLIRRYRWNRQRPRPFDILSSTTSIPAMYEQGASDYELAHLFAPYVVGQGTQTNWEPQVGRGSQSTTSEPPLRSRRSPVTMVPTIVIIEPSVPTAGTARVDTPPRITVERDAEDAMRLPSYLPPPYPLGPSEASGPSAPSQSVPSHPRPSSSSSVPHIRPLPAPAVQSAVHPFIPPRDKGAIPLIPPRDQGKKDDIDRRWVM
ncbi:hypothetical protein FRB96_005247 [Tulasnella sp. 330]|nr:hypothetical protein FRB96_005247 [Tulasnella sp. 330]KAG8874742.1 hypothetical protein FRB98_008246 [Tulasnella sp. 332]